MAQTRTDKFNDWAVPTSRLDGDSARNICHYVVVYFSHSFHNNIDFSGSLVLYMCKVSVGSVSKILLVLTQSLYVV